MWHDNAVTKAKMYSDESSINSKEHLRALLNTLQDSKPLIFGRDKIVLIIMSWALCFLATQLLAFPKRQVLGPKILNSSYRMKVLVENVGQGNCILVQFPDCQSLLYDAGSSKFPHSLQNRDAMIEKISQDSQTLLNQKKINTLVVSHPDFDHYSLIHHFFQKQTLDQIFLGQTRQQYNNAFQEWLKQQEQQGAAVIESLNMEQAQSYSFGNDTAVSQVQLLAANASHGKDSNADSLVMRFVLGHISTLLTGDADHETWIQQLKHTIKHPGLQSTFLLFAHHGSNAHGCNEKNFLEAVSPQVGIFSAGGRYGHPRESVSHTCHELTSFVSCSKHPLTLWKNIETSVCQNEYQALFSTFDQGAVLLETDGQSFQVSVENWPADLAFFFRNKAMKKQLF